ncbi:FMN-dependent oxidoreductase, nitrilotriacetate monooxygenase family [Thermomonospora echinospora]|uniref:FMN-dependent oxidoreductase, nitrilotriacetate monooxygenase family n=1 Tax=Thermomonospora echinospora TaxID=1992 RepID=A0A1H6DYH9_9ACTN|nr:NtaA/DmoA family FMN-dependent monooxygenase [Thermomonospora echinospora]SEG90378.1 FMN-dependent oxidoreductase, nitrilotriacetate monooxygenase family [Thermomonospora echinospora]
MGKRHGRHIHLGLWLTFLDAADWRNPDSRAEELNSLAPYVEVAEIGERAKLDALIRGDGLGLPLPSPDQAYAGSLEILTLLAALAARTEKIGLIGTASTTFTEPYNLARTLATLDHISNGRVGWNIVTSVAGEEQFGYDQIPGHEERYERADEFIEVVSKLWASWESDAVLVDRENGVFFDPKKINRIDHHGKHFHVAGPLNIARPPQGRPVFVQAGDSDRGRNFAAEHAELVFTAQRDLEKAQAFYRDVKERVKRQGRDESRVSILPGLVVTIGATEAEARELHDQFLARIDYERTRTSLEALLGGIDLSDIDLDEQVPEERLPEAATLTRQPGRAQIFVDLAKEKGATLRQLLQALGTAHGHGRVFGTPRQVADHIERWAEAGAADGFAISPAQGLAGARLFADEVVPILQDRGVFRREYTGSTLRDHFGLWPVS